MQFQEVEAAVKKNKIDNVTPSSPNSIISLNKKIKKVKSTSKQLQEEVNFKNKKIFTTTDLDWIDDMMMTMNDENDDVGDDERKNINDNNNDNNNDDSKYYEIMSSDELLDNKTP
jgi:hypothetical protein